LKAGYFFSIFPAPTRSGNIYKLKCLSFILEHPDHGVMIFDTGTPSDSELALFLKESFNINCEAVSWVFNTHIHPDHVGGNHLFKNAKIVLSRKDFEESERIARVVFDNKDLKHYLHTNFTGYHKTFDDFETEQMKLYTKNYWSEEKIGINSRTLYIEDTPKIPDFINIIPTSGHTTFHHSYKIKGKTADYFITGDAVSSRLILNGGKENRLTEPHMDFDKFFESLAFFENQKAFLIPGHDRPFFSTTKQTIKENIFDIDL